MSTSEEQFPELLSQLGARVNRMLSAGSEVFPVGLLLMPDGDVDVSVAAYEDVDQIPALINAMQSSLAEKAKDLRAVASCISYPDYSAQEVVAFLENNENFCATFRLPVVEEPDLHLDLQNVVVEDGGIYIFPVANG